MSSTVRLVAARSGMRAGLAAVKATGKATGSTGLVAASRTYAHPRSAAVAAMCKVSQLSFTRGFMSTADDKAAAAVTKKATASKTKKAAPKKAAAKKTLKKKPAAKKAAKKVAKPNKKKKLVIRKVLTAEQKEKAAAKKQAQAIRDLRKEALLKDKPTLLPARSWILYVTENTKGIKGAAGENGPTVLKKQMAELSKSYKELSAHELERLRATAAQNQEKNEAAYKAWTESHSPAAIFAANRARRQLIKLAKEGKTAPLRGSNKKALEDHRLPKLPAPLYALFVQDKWAGGDYSAHSMMDAAKAINTEWKNLSEAEREKYAAQRKAIRESYEKELSAALKDTHL